MKSIILGLTAILAFSAMARAEWVRSNNDPAASIAEARCNLMAMNADQGYFAWGSQGYVLGAALGNVIGNAIRRAEVKRNCMAMHGYRYVSNRGLKRLPANARPSFQRKRGKRGKLSRACERARTMAEMNIHCTK